MSATNPAVAGSILRSFSIAAVTAVGAVYAADRIISIASRKQMEERSQGQAGGYNENVHPEQDPLDTIFDRTKLLNSAKQKKPWNMTLAEKERAKR